MTLEEKLIRRIELRAEIAEKCKKIAKISQILSKNKSELSSMVASHNKLDREIFEAKHGITRITSVKRKQITPEINDEFLDGLSKEACLMLLQRLHARAN